MVCSICSEFRGKAVGAFNELMALKEKNYEL